MFQELADFERMPNGPEIDEKSKYFLNKNYVL